VFTPLQEKQIFRIRIEVLSIDSTGVKVHPDTSDTRKKTGISLSESPAEAETSKFIWLPLLTE
jgi:hypothetical protein